MRKKLSLTLAFLALFAASVPMLRAEEWKTMEDIDNGLWLPWAYSTATFVTGSFSTQTINGIWMSLSVQAISADATFEIRYSSGQAVAPSENAWRVLVSSTITVLSGQSKTFPWVRSRIKNGQVIIKSVGSGGTVYVDAERLIPNQ